MISQAFSKAVLLLGIAALYFGSVCAQVIDPVVTYPYISVTPANPAAGKDSVNLHCALGSAGNGCMAPTFTDIAFTIQQSPLTVFPPMFNVSLSYTTVPVPPDRMCPMIYAPVDYGPSFALGKLSLGSYTVTDQTTKRQVGTFSVTAALQTLKDTVYVTPPNPMTKDSLHFDLFNASFNCCMQYYNKNVSVSDTVIVLSFQYLDTSKCMCLMAGSHTAFACGPQKAGKYAIYKEQSVYCATPPCPLVAGPIQLVRVGSVTVGGTAVAGPPAFASAPGNGLDLRQEKGSVQMNYSINKAARMRVTVYNAAGMVAGKLYNGQVSSGAHRFSWKAAAPGIYLMSVEINGAAACSRKIIVSQ